MANEDYSSRKRSPSRKRLKASNENMNEVDVKEIVLIPTLDDEDFDESQLTLIDADISFDEITNEDLLSALPNDNNELFQDVFLPLNENKIETCSDFKKDLADYNNEKRDNENVSINEPEFQACSNCEKYYLKLSDGTLHRPAFPCNKVQKPTNSRRQTRSSTNLFNCGYCLYTAKSTNDVYSHIKQDHYIAKINCRHCRKPYFLEIREEIKYHEQKDHRFRNFPLTRYAQCKKCLKISEKEDPDHECKGINFSNMCGICRQVFPNIKSLSSHVQSHKNENTHFDCHLCSASFSTIKMLEDHLVIEHY